MTTDMSVQEGGHGVEASASDVIASHAHLPPSDEPNTAHVPLLVPWALPDATTAEPFPANLLAEDQGQIDASVTILGDVVGSKLSKAELLDLKWNEMFQRLCRYREQHGDCLVPRSYPNDKALGHWCGNQRMLRKRNTLQADRLQRLESIGFSFVADERYVWSGGRNKKHLTDHWSGMYAALIEYRKQHGHALVPKGYVVVVQGSGTTTKVPLGRWVCRQRTSLSQGTLPADRKEQLDALGFVWKPNAESEATRSTRARRRRGEPSGTEVPPLPSGLSASASASSPNETQEESPKKNRKSDGLAILA